MTQRATADAYHGTAPERREKRQRHRRQLIVSAWLDLPLALLAIVWLLLLLVEFTVDSSPKVSEWLLRGQLAIWVIFVAAFVFEFSLAVDKLRFLRRNWLTMIALVAPPLRILRVFKALRVLRGARVIRSLAIVRASAAVNRAGSSFQEFVRISQFAYVVLLTVVVTIMGAAGGYYLERGVEESPIQTFGEALWWAATIVTTISSPLEAETVEGRVVGLLLRVFGVVAVGYLTARLAVYFLGARDADEAHRNAELRGIRDEIARLRDDLDERSRDS